RTTHRVAPPAQTAPPSPDHGSRTAAPLRAGGTPPGSGPSLLRRSRDPGSPWAHPPAPAPARTPPPAPPPPAAAAPRSAGPPSHQAGRSPVPPAALPRASGAPPAAASRTSSPPSRFPPP